MDLPEISPDSVIEFPDGVPGLGELRRFVVLRPDDVGPLVLLQSVEDREVSLPLVPAAAVHAEYRLNLDAADLEALGADSSAGLAALAVVILPGAGGAAACNLFAPIVVNFEKRLGRQVLQAGSEYPTVFPLVGA